MLTTELKSLVDQIIKLYRATLTTSSATNTEDFVKDFKVSLYENLASQPPQEVQVGQCGPDWFRAIQDHARKYDQACKPRISFNGYPESQSDWSDQDNVLLTGPRCDGSYCNSSIDKRPEPPQLLEFGGQDRP